MLLLLRCSPLVPPPTDDLVVLQPIIDIIGRGPARNNRATGMLEQQWFQGSVPFFQTTPLKFSPRVILQPDTHSTSHPNLSSSFSLPLLIVAHKIPGHVSPAPVLPPKHPGIPRKMAPPFLPGTVGNYAFSIFPCCLLRTTCVMLHLKQGYQKVFRLGGHDIILFWHPKIGGGTTVRRRQHHEGGGKEFHGP